MKQAASCSPKRFRKEIRRTFALSALLVFLIGAVAMDSAGSVANVFISQAGAGTQDGLTCGSAKPVSFFNNSANWGAGAAQIGPGTVVHLCGTFSDTTRATMLTAQGSGSAGNPITILFETGANLSSSAGWPLTGAINISGRSYIVVNGGPTCGYVGGTSVACNGTIQNINAGTNLGLDNHAAPASCNTTPGACFYFTGRGVYAGDNNGGACSPGCRVTNMNIINMWVRIGGSTDYNVDQQKLTAITAWPAAGFRADHNIIHDVGWALDVWGNNQEFDHNDIYNMDHGTAGGIYNTGGFIDGELIHDNHFHDMANWDTPTAQAQNPCWSSTCYHHDGVHIWASNRAADTNRNHMIYNNLFDGDIGNQSTAWFYEEDNATGIKNFNNVYVLINDTTRTPGNGLLGMGGGTHSGLIIANNTFKSLNAAGTAIDLDGYAGTIFENNLFAGSNTFIYGPNGTSFSPGDYNLYEAQGGIGGNNRWHVPPIDTSDFPTWQGGGARDTNGHYFAASDVNNNGTLQAGSHAIGTGTNLTSLGITALNSDKNGVARPSSGAWDIGAIQAGGGGGGGTPAVSISPSPVAFGNQTQNTSSAAATVTVTNSGTASLVLSASFFTFSGANAGDWTRSGGSCANNATIVVGANCTVLVVFRPVTIGAETGTLTINGNANGSVSLTGTGTAAGTTSMSVTPGSFNFGTVAQGTTSTSTVFTLTNTGTLNVTLAVPVTTFSGPNAADFTLAGTQPANQCQGGQVLAPGATCTKSVVATPSTGGAESATMTLSATTTSATTALAVTGQGLTSVLTITPSPIMSFGAVVQGQTGGAVTATVTNSGSGSVTLAVPNNVISGTNAADWTNTTTGTCTNGLVLAPAATCTIILNFHPVLAAAETATLTVNGSGGATSSTSMTGTGVAPSPLPAPIPWIFAMTCTTMSPISVKCKMSLPAAAVSLPGLAKGPYVLTLPGGLEITVEVK